MVKKMLKKIFFLTIMSFIFLCCEKPTTLENLREEYSNKNGDTGDTSNEFVWTDPDTGYAWSKKSNNYWADAVNYCTSIGGRLPTISELRTLIKNCVASEADGDCGVTDSCYNPSECDYETMKEYKCDDCESATDGRYSKLGDTDYFFSSTSTGGDDGSYLKWGVLFSSGHIYYESVLSYSYDFRCVK